MNLVISGRGHWYPVRCPVDWGGRGLRVAVGYEVTGALFASPTLGGDTQRELNGVKSLALKG